MWLFSIIGGVLISILNLSLLLKSRRNMLFIFIRYIFLCFFVLFLLYLGTNPIFLAIGFAIFPFFIALLSLRRKG